MERRIRLAGMSCLVGGILWVITLALMPEVTVGSLSYIVIEIALVAAQVMLLIGVLGLAWSGAAGNWLVCQNGAGHSPAGQGGVRCRRTAGVRLWLLRLTIATGRRACLRGSGCCS